MVSANPVTALRIGQNITAHCVSAGTSRSGYAGVCENLNRVEKRGWINSIPIYSTTPIETMHMVKKGQLHCPNGQAMSAAEQFYSLAF
jgi:hypothetical protein